MEIYVARACGSITHYQMNGDLKILRDVLYADHYITREDLQMEAEAYQREAEDYQQAAEDYQKAAECSQKATEYYQKAAEDYRREAEFCQRQAEDYQTLDNKWRAWALAEVEYYRKKLKLRRE